MAITKRADKGAALSYEEMDANFDAVAPRDSATGAIEIPTGTTGEQPASPVVGQLRFNTQLNLFEGYFDTLGWSALAASGVSGEVNQNAWAEIAVAGQTNVAADQKSDVLTFVAGTDISITTNATADSITINSTYTPPSNVSAFTNDSGYLTSETTTTLTADSVNTKLVFTDETGTANDIDLSWTIDDTNLARITSGTVDGATGIATFTRDDATTFTTDFSALFDDTNLTRITSGSFNSGTGDLTLTRSDATTAATISLDGRYLTSYTVTESDVTQHQAALSITQSQISDLAHYSNSDVDSHLNTGTALGSQILSWTGTDYDWVAQPSGGLANVVEDTTPQLGGNLDVNSNSITGTTVNITTTTNGDVVIQPSGTGGISLRKSYDEHFVSLGTLFGTEQIDVGTASHFYGSIQSNVTFQFIGETATTNQVDSFTLYLYRATSFSITLTWPAEVQWSNGTAPALPGVGEMDIYVFTTINNGTSWFGFQAGDAMA